MIVGMAVDPDGNLFVPDLAGHRVRRVDALTGVVTTVVGTGVQGYSGDGGPADASRLNSPYAVALDRAGNLYIADNGNNIVRRVDATTAQTASEFVPSTSCIGTLLPGDTCQMDFTFAGAFPGAHHASVAVTDNTPGPQQKAALVSVGTRPVLFPYPTAVAFANQAVGTAGPGKPVVIANSGNGPLTLGNIQVIQMVGPVAVIDPQDFPYTSACAPTLQPGASCVVQVAFAPTDPGLQTAVLRIVSDTVGSPRDIPIQGTGVVLTLTASPDVLAFADQGVATSSAPRPVLISNTGAGDIALQAPVLAGAHAADFHLATDCTPVLVRPSMCLINVTFTPTDVGSRFAELRVASNAAGSPLVVALSGNGLSSKVISIAPAAVDFGPQTVAGTPVHRTVTITNAGTARVSIAPVSIQRTQTTTGFIRTIAGTGTAGSAGDDGPATAAQIGNAFGVALDAAGNQYIADTSNNRVRRIDALTGVITTVAGTGAAGYSGDGGPALSATLDGPVGVVVDALGRVDVSERGNHVIRRIDAAGVITTLAGTGLPGCAGDGAAATSAELHSPNGIAVDRDGNLFIADSLNHAVRRVSAAGVITTIVGSMNPGSAPCPVSLQTPRVDTPEALAVDSAGTIYVADAVTGTVGAFSTGTSTFNFTVASNLNEPGGIAVDALGRVYVADTLESVIRRYHFAPSPSGPPFVATTFFAGSSLGGGFGGDGSQAVGARLSLPRGLAVDTSGNLFIADSGNRRIGASTPPPRRPTSSSRPASVVRFSIRPRRVTWTSRSHLPLRSRRSLPWSSTTMRPAGRITS